MTRWYQFQIAHCLQFLHSTIVNKAFFILQLITINCQALKRDIKHTVCIFSILVAFFPLKWNLKNFHYSFYTNKIICTIENCVANYSNELKSRIYLSTIFIFFLYTSSRDKKAILSLIEGALQGGVISTISLMPRLNRLFD